MQGNRNEKLGDAGEDIIQHDQNFENFVPTKMSNWLPVSENCAFGMFFILCTMNAWYFWSTNQMMNRKGHKEPNDCSKILLLSGRVDTNSERNTLTKYNACSGNE
jgi:hypothetical protein